MDEDIDVQSLLEYARLHGLAIDSSTAYVDDALSQHARSTAFAASAELNVNEAVPSQGPIITEEKLILDAASRDWLISIIGPYDCDPFKDTISQGSRTKQLKVELPVLITDGELDLRLSKRQDTSLGLAHTLEEWKVNVELDEGLAWPKKLLRLPADYTRQHLADKVQLSAETVLLLQNALATDEDRLYNFPEEEFVHEPRKHGRLTPPLSPAMSPSLSIKSEDPIVPALFSNAPPSTARKADIATEKLIEDNDGSLRQQNVPKLDRSMWNLRPELPRPTPSSPSAQGLSSPLARKAIKAKIEEPLTPPSTVGFFEYRFPSESLDLILPDLDKHDHRSSPSSEQLEACFNDVIHAEAVRAGNEVQQEMLEEPSTTVTIAVPDLDFSIPPLPWRNPDIVVSEKQDTQDIMLWIAKLKCHHWSVSKIEKSLPWVPVMLLPGSTALNELITDKGHVTRYVSAADPTELVDMDSLTWKPDGLRILEDHEDEDELEPGTLHSATKVQSFVSNRREVLPAGLAEVSVTPSARPGDSANLPSTPRATVGQQVQTTSSHLFDFGFASAANQLDHFISMQSGEVKRRKIEIVPSPSTTVTGNSPHNINADDVAKCNPPITTPGPNEPGPEAVALPAPPLNDTDVQRPMFVASSILTSRRQLIKHVTRLYPAVELISRNHTEAATTQPHDALLADFVISPGVGILCTTLQGLRQRPLPGQEAKDQSLIRARVALAAPQFERLYLLVSQGKENLTLNETIDERDCEVLTEAINFAGALDDQVDTVFIGGGEENLARWIVGLLNRCPLVAAGVNVLQDETTVCFILVIQACLTN